MGLELRGLIEDLEQKGAFRTLVNNPLSQFGLRNNPLLGASLLPNRDVFENMFTENGIRYRSNLANAGTRYSPVQLKEGALSGSFDVKLSYSDIGSELTASNYDALVNLIKRSAGSPENLDRPGMEAVAQLTDWLRTVGVIPLEWFNEKMRWDLIVNATATLSGDGGFTETISIPDPAGHRAALAGDWTDDNYDPMDDLMAMVDLATSKGYTLDRMITSRAMSNKLRGNGKMELRLGRISIMSGTVAGQPSNLSLSRINQYLASENLPPIEEYNSTYQTQTGSGFFLDRAAVVMLAMTGRDQSINLPDADPILLSNTLGYTAIGTAAGQANPGRVLKSYAFDNKPPRVECEGWQASFPVIQDPEAIYVLTDES